MNTQKKIVLIFLLSFLSTVLTSAQTKIGGEILYTAFSPDNSLLATIHKGGRINLWSMPGLTPLYTVEHIWGSSSSSTGKMVFNKQGDFILGGDGRSTLFDVKKRKEFDLPYDIDIKRYNFSFDGRSLIGLKVDGKKSEVYTIHFNNPKTLPAKPDFTLKGAYQIEEYAPGHFVYGTEGMINFLRKGEKAPFIQLPSANYNLSSDGRYVILSSFDVYDLSSTTPEKVFNLANSEYAQSEKRGAICNNKILVTGNGKCTVYQLSTGKKEREIDLQKLQLPSYAKSHAVSKDGNFLAYTMAPAINLRLIELETGRFFELTETYFGAARNYALLKNADSTILLMNKSLSSSKKPNLQLVQQDTLFSFLKENPSWKELLSQSWYNESEKLAMAGDLKFLDNKYEEALDLYTKSVAADPSSVLGYEGKAMTYSRMKKPDDAEGECNKCLAINNRNVNCNLILAAIYEDKDMKEKAANLYFAVAANDVTKYGLMVRGMKLMKDVNFNTAKDMMWSYLDMVSNDASAYVLRAEMRSGDMQEVGMYYAEAVRAEPKEEYYKLAIDYYLKGDNVSSSRRLAEDWLKHEPTNPTAQLYLDKVEGKIKERSNVAATNPGDPQACGICQGSGSMSLDYNCFSCHGKGKKTCSACGGRRFTYNSSGQSSYCYSCRGEGSSVCGACYGKKPSKTTTCSSCHGTGKK